MSGPTRDTTGCIESWSTGVRAPSRTAAIALGLAGALACGATPGCSAPAMPAAVATTHITGAPLATAHPAHAELSAVVRAEDDDADDDPRGTLVIDGDVVESCDALRSMQAAARPGEPADNMAWLAILKSVAACMTSGELRDQHVALHGASRAQVIVRYVFTRLGVDEARVDLTPAPAGLACADDCDAADRRVDIGLR
jgi:hypothetical protein